MFLPDEEWARIVVRRVLNNTDGTFGTNYSKVFLFRLTIRSVYLFTLTLAQRVHARSPNEEAHQRVYLIKSNVIISSTRRNAVPCVI